MTWVVVDEGWKNKAGASQTDRSGFCRKGLARKASSAGIQRYYQLIYIPIITITPENGLKFVPSEGWLYTASWRRGRELRYPRGPPSTVAAPPCREVAF